MKIHEYQAKELFHKYGVPVPRGKAAFSVDEAKAIAAELGSFPVVIKAQIHAGGRGKGGGVKLANSPDEVEQISGSILGMTLVTHQTGPEGKPVRRLLVEEGLQIEKELYLSMLPDRSTASIVIMASEAGGMDIEEVAAKTPEKIIKVQVNPLLGLQGFHARQLAYGLNLEAELVKLFIPMVSKLYKLFCDYDCSLLEINPLIITKDKKVLALDAKVNFDDSGLFRHKDIMAYRDLDEEDPSEVEASKYNLNYIKMDGNIGNMVNGAGLAMATMDQIKLFGGAPANFLDVGGSSSPEKVLTALNILRANPRLKAILINIFGGITRCDDIARGILIARRQADLALPLVIRLVGTNQKEGTSLLAAEGLTALEDMSEAVRKVIEAAHS
jgi:succinyl-CoA synthetase beta subunit